MSKPLTLVCGLKAEAKIAAGKGATRSDATILVGGGDGLALAAALDAAAPTSGGFLSFGVAGGLDPALGPGTCRIASAILGPDGTRYATDTRWSAALGQRLGVPLVLMAGVDLPLAGTADKSALHRSTGAALVDMESHIVARAAAHHGLPFAALRVVTDGADHSLPHAATVGMRADGKVDIVAILRSLARDPGQIPALIRTARDARAAFATLLRSRELLGAGFGFGGVDLGDPLLDMA